MQRRDHDAVSFPLLLTAACLLAIAGCGGSTSTAPDPSDGNGAGKHNPQLKVLTEPWSDQNDVPWEIASLLGRLSKAAYLDEQEADAVFQEIGFEKSTTHVSGSMTFYVVRSGRLAVVVFRGTDDLADWLVNLKASTTSVTGGNLHTGFHEAYQTLRSDVHAALNQAQPEDVWITGHSLGGALAVVWMQQDGVTRTPVVAQGENPGARRRRTRPLGPPPLEEKEFKQLQDKLRKSKRPSKNRPAFQPAVVFPPIDDHAMDRYVKRIDDRGQAIASERPMAAERPTRRPKLPIGPPTKRPGPPKLP